MIIRYEEIYVEWTIFDIFGDQFFKGTCNENLQTLLNIDPIKFEYFLSSKLELNKKLTKDQRKEV